MDWLKRLFYTGVISLSLLSPVKAKEKKLDFVPIISAYGGGKIGESQKSQFNDDNEKKILVLRNNGEYELNLQDIKIGPISTGAYIFGKTSSEDIFDFIRDYDQDSARVFLSSEQISHSKMNFGGIIDFKKNIFLAVEYVDKKHTIDFLSRDFNWQKGASNSYDEDSLEQIIEEGPPSSEQIVDFFSEFLQTTLGEASEEKKEFEREKDTTSLRISAKMNVPKKGLFKVNKNLDFWIAASYLSAKSYDEFKDEINDSTSLDSTEKIRDFSARIGGKFSKEVDNGFFSTSVENNYKQKINDYSPKINIRYLWDLRETNHIMSFKFSNGEIADNWHKDCPELKTIFYKIHGRKTKSNMEQMIRNLKEEDGIQYSLYNDDIKRLLLNENKSMGNARFNSSFAGYSGRLVNDEAKHSLILGTYRNGAGGMYVHNFSDNCGELHLTLGRNFVFSASYSPEGMIEGFVQTKINLK